MRPEVYGERDPVFSDSEVEQINETLSIVLHFGEHETADDARRIYPAIAAADLIVPEGAGWDEFLLQAANVYSATKEQKASMSAAQRELTTEFAVRINAASEYVKTLFKATRNTGKEIRFIDVEAGHPLATVEAAEQVNSWHDIKQAAAGAQSGNIMADVRTFRANLSDFTALMRERELTIRSNVRTLLSETAMAADSSEEPRSVLMIFGAGHASTTRWLQTAGIHARMSPTSHIPPIGIITALGMQMRDGHEPTDLDLARTLLTNLWYVAAEQTSSAAIAGSDDPTRTLNDVANYFAHNFTFDDMRQIWEAPDMATAAGRFLDIKQLRQLDAYDADQSTPQY